MKKVPVLTITARGNVVSYDSVRAAGIALSGNGRTVKDKVSAICSEGGGYIGSTYVANGTAYSNK